MDKWADYVIVGVQYNEDKSQILRVRRCPDLGDELGGMEIVSRERVVYDIHRGTSHATAYLIPGDNAWQMGNDVGIVTVKGTDFIRTDRNHTEADNLGRLPDF